jgi:mono/diheme cytochrome c family protein
MRNPIKAMLVTAVLATAGVPPAHGAGLTAAEGRSLAQQYCSACHRVTREQAQPPDVVVDTGSATETFQAPSFARIAARPDRTEAQLRERILNPHYPMREQQFIPEELDAIVAYLLSLRAPGAAADWQD